MENSPAMNIYMNRTAPFFKRQSVDESFFTPSKNQSRANQVSNSKGSSIKLNLSSMKKKKRISNSIYSARGVLPDETSRNEKSIKKDKSNDIDKFSLVDKDVKQNISRYLQYIEGKNFDYPKTHDSQIDDLVKTCFNEDTIAKKKRRYWNSISQTTTPAKHYNDYEDTNKENSEEKVDRITEVDELEEPRKLTMSCYVEDTNTLTENKNFENEQYSKQLQIRQKELEEKEKELNEKELDLKEKEQIITKSTKKYDPIEVHLALNYKAGPNGLIGGFQSSLFNHLFESNILTKISDPRKGFYCHYGSDKKPDFSLGNHVYVNRMPGFVSLSKKDMCFELLNKYRSFHSNLFKFYPKSFSLPTEYAKYKKYHKSKPSKVFISKISNSSHGFGCSQIKRASELPETAKLQASSKRILQEYIMKPFLMNNLKHDLRVYVAIVSYDPFIAFINEEGLARFCTEDYSEPQSKKAFNRVNTNGKETNEFSHFSNYTLNKCNSNYVQNDECFEINNGSKRTFASYFKQLKEEYGYEKEPIWCNIKSICASIMKAYKPYIQYHCKCHFPFRNGKLFHILGIDIMQDQNMKPYLLEINSNPSQNVDYSADDKRPGTSMCTSTVNNDRKENIKSRDDKSREPRKRECKVDVYVKERALVDVLFMLKSKSINEIRSEKFKTFRSYIKLFDEHIEEKVYKHVSEFDKMLKIFIELNGSVKFSPTLSKAKFVKCIKWFNRLGNETLQLMDGDNAYNNVIRDRGQMDFQGFISAFYELVNKSYGSCDGKVIKARIHDVFNRYDWQTSRLRR